MNREPRTPPFPPTPSLRVAPRAGPLIGCLLCGMWWCWPAPARAGGGRSELAPVEALQRSVQMRWGAAHPGDNACTTFPARDDEAAPPALPPDGFYGADTLDPGRLGALLADLESKVGVLADQYVTATELEGSGQWEAYSPWGNATYLDTGGIRDARRIGRFIAPLGPAYPAPERIRRLQEMLRRMRDTPVAVGTCYYTTREGRGYAGAHEYSQAYQIAAADWHVAATGVDTLSQLPRSNMRYNVGDQGGGGGFPLTSFAYLSVQTIRCAERLGHSTGALTFYGLGCGAALALDGPSSDGRWHAFDTKQAGPVVTSRNFCIGPPSSRGQQDVSASLNTVGAMFRGTFQDSWASWCESEATDTPAGAAAPGCADCGPATLGSIDVAVPLGPTDHGTRRATVRLKALKPHPDLADPNNLLVAVGDTGLVIGDTAGTPLQAIAPEAAANFSTDPAYAGGRGALVIAVYPAAALGAVQPDGTRALTGDPERETVVVNPATVTFSGTPMTAVEVIESRAGAPR